MRGAPRALPDDAGVFLDPEAKPHPQTLVTRFGSWNRAKRKAGLVARRFATRANSSGSSGNSAPSLGGPRRAPISSVGGRSMPSKSLYWQTFGSFRSALRAAGFDVPRTKERSDRAVQEGARLAKRLGRPPSFDDWARARARDARLPSEWQVYRLFGGRKGAWAAFLRRVERGAR